MGKTILTSKQLNFLELIQQDKQITKRFYFTGGTALAEFYLHHRLSEDIDLFTEEEEVNQQVVRAFLEKISSKLEVVKMDPTQFMGLFSFLFHFKDGKTLKVDFDTKDLPKMLVAFNRKKMEQFFLSEAKKLKKEILK